MTQFGQKYPISYLFSPFSLQLQFSVVLCLFLTLQTHLFHLLTCEKQITKDFSVYCKWTKRQHNTKKKQKVSFTISFFDFSFSNCTYESSSMKWEKTLSVLFWFIFFFQSNPIFHLSNIVCWKLSINFLLEILIFNFIIFNRLSFFFYEFIFHELIM